MSFIEGTILNPAGHALLPNGSRPRLSIKLLQFVENPVPFFAHTPDTATPFLFRLIHPAHSERRVNSTMLFAERISICICSSAIIP